jgi:hypothetical protein
MCEYSVSRLRGVLCCRMPGNYNFVWVSTCTLDGCIVLHPLFFGDRRTLRSLKLKFLSEEMTKYGNIKVIKISK